MRRESHTRHGRRSTPGVLVLCLLLAAPAAALDPPGKALGRKGTITAPGGTPGPERRVSVLVRVEPGRRPEVRDVARSLGGRVHYEYLLLPQWMSLRDLPESAVARLERTAGVVRVEPDAIVRIHLNQSAPLVNALRAQVEGAGFTADGANVRVCVVDTGIDSDHVMYADRIDAAAGRDFVNGDADPEDDHGHGAHVAGIAVGGDGNTIDFGCAGDEPFQGVAWEATLIGVKVVDALGFGFASDLIAGIDHCADASASGGRADVINMSLGGGEFAGPCDGDPVAEAANAAVAAGVVVVASAGNSGEPDALASPACGTSVLAVGATYDDDYPSCEWPFPECWEWCLESDGICGCLQSCVDCFPSAKSLACFSNRSALLDVVAPGCVTASANVNDPGGSEYMCGTSMAAPHVTGLAALLLSHDPSLTPAEVGQAIRDGAEDLGAAGPDPVFGHGQIDAIASLSLLTGCVTDADCDDGNLCTTDACDTASGSCQNLTVDCSDGDLCTTDTCDPATGVCANPPLDCSDGDACTADSCDPATGVCANELPACGLADGCCVGSCGDPDCPVCAPLGASCTDNSDCCSGKCRGKPGSQTCR